MATQTTENYLKAIYFLSQKDENVSLTDLGRSMNVSTPTANSMVKKLERRGWVKYQKYKPLKLTKKGELEAALIIRKHRLTEMFLSEIMGFGWEEVHDIAEEMEHLKSERFFERMNEMLSFPTIDPHGSPIPNAKGEINIRNRTRLSEIEPGTKVYLVGFEESSKSLLLYLNKKEIELGTEISVKSIEEFDQSMNVSYLNKTDTLSFDVTNLLLVEKK